MNARLSSPDTPAPGPDTDLLIDNIALAAALELQGIAHDGLTFRTKPTGRFIVFRFERTEHAETIVRAWLDGDLRVPARRYSWAIRNLHRLATDARRDAEGGQR